jgi:hypothetical protein
MNVPDGFQIDHIDGDGLNNQKSNLRIGTHQQNIMNRTKQRNNTSGYKGVSFDKSTNKFVAQIGYNKKGIHIGSFKTAILAARAYDVEAIKYHGEFANLNFKPGQD